MRLDPRVAAVRSAVARSLGQFDADATILVACSGGSDSLALAAAASFHGTRRTGRTGAVVVDHGLQPESQDIAASAVNICQRLGLDPVHVVEADVDGSRNVEAHARTARYLALEQAAETHGASAVLLGHTLDDQAETVLLGLARGSGTRSLAGMPPHRGIFHRPMLALRRHDVARAGNLMLHAAGIDQDPWTDPHNADPAYARARVRHRVLPVLESQLGPGIAQALARTADQLRRDTDLLEILSVRLLNDARTSETSYAVDVLASAHSALRHRAIHRLIVELGAPAGRVSATHVDAVDALVTEWHGQGPVSLPGRAQAARGCGKLWVTTQHPRQRVESS